VRPLFSLQLHLSLNPNDPLPRASSNRRLQALELLRGARPGWQSHVQRMKTVGFRAYTTSCGWLGFPEDVVRAKCREAMADGHRHFKMKASACKHDCVPTVRPTFARPPLCQLLQSSQLPLLYPPWYRSCSAKIVAPSVYYVVTSGLP